MKTVIRKAFWNYENEEVWLNQMSAKGLALVDYSWCKYTFEPTEKDLYTYRIELLDKLPTHSKSRAYIDFLEESGVEYVASYMFWIYLRKKTAEGAFEIYTDLESQISHYHKVCTFWYSLMALELLCGLIQLHVGRYSLALLFGLIVFLLSRVVAPLRAKLRILKREQLVVE